MLITLAKKGLLGHFLWPSPSPGSGLAIGKEFRSIGPLGSELWPFKEGQLQICLKSEVLVTLFVSPFSNGYNSGPECNFSENLKAQHQVLGMHLP